MFKTGDRVNLIAGVYTIGQDNPLIGTEWECVGTIQSHSEAYISVSWDNGSHNVYQMYDLAYADSDVLDPNVAFKAERGAGGRR